MNLRLDGLSPQFEKKMDKANSWLPIPLKNMVVKVKKRLKTIGMQVTALTREVF